MVIVVVEEPGSHFQQLKDVVQPCFLNTLQPGKILYERLGLCKSPQIFCLDEHKKVY